MSVPAQWFFPRAFRWGPWLVLLVGTLGALTIAGLEYRLENTREQAHFMMVANDRMEVLAKEARTLLRPVRHVAAVLTFAAGDISAPEFDQVGRSIPLTEPSVLLALQWHRYVPAEDAWVMERCYHPHGTACSRTLSPELVERVRHKDRLSVSSWYQAEGQVRIQALRPIFRTAANEELLGIVVGVYRVDRLIASALTRVGSAPVALYIRDYSSPSAGVFGYRHGAVRYVGNTLPQGPVTRRQTSETVPLYGGPGYNLAAWEVLAVADPGSYIASPWPPLVSGFIGAAFSVLLTLYLRDLQIRELKVRDLVTVRTEELARRELEFETLAEGNPDMIARIDRQLRYVYVNTAIAHLFGPPREAFIGRRLGRLGLPADVAREVRRGAKAAFETGESQFSEHRLITESGERFFDARFLPEKGTGGKVETLLLVARDITAQKQLQRELEQLSLRDPLTGAANRRFLTQFSERGWRRERRDHHDVALILADLDHFKEYNDIYGHQRGDTCLSQIALTLQRSLYRPADTLVRYGGEEFAIILPDTGLDAAKQLAQRVRGAVEDENIPHAASPTGFVTISIGVAAMNATQSEFDELVAAADKALYCAKENGRNRVESAPRSGGR